MWLGSQAVPTESFCTCCPLRTAVEAVSSPRASAETRAHPLREATDQCLGASESERSVDRARRVHVGDETDANVGAHGSAAEARKALQHRGRTRVHIARRQSTRVRAVQAQRAAEPVVVEEAEEDVRECRLTCMWPCAGGSAGVPAVSLGERGSSAG